MKEPYVNSGDGGAASPGGSFPPPQLRVNRDSHLIKKPPSPSSSSSIAASKPRHPVIIYTHSPKVIHTNPKNFMALVQKLTGIPRSDEDSTAAELHGKPPATRGHDEKVNTNNRYHHQHHHHGRDSNNTGNQRGIFVNNAIFTEDSESSSAITTEDNIGEQGQVNSLSSCYLSGVPTITPQSSYPPPPPPPPPPSPMMMIYDAMSSTAPGRNCGGYLSSIPTNPSEICGNEGMGNYDIEQLMFGPSIISSVSSSSSSGFDGFAEFRDF